MANNRLYIGNKDTKEYILLAKDNGVGWAGPWDVEKLQEFLETQFDEGHLGSSTNLVLFTEYDPLHDEFHEANKPKVNS